MSRSALTLHLFASLEAQRVARGGRGFTLVRVVPAGWAALDREVEALATLVSAHLRRTDFAARVGEREVGAVLVDAVNEQAFGPVQRLRAAAAEQLPRLEVRIGWASVGPGQKWEEAWRWAGQLLLAEAAVPAAA